MKNSVFSKVRLLAGAVLVASLLMLVGCKPIVSGDLVGTWVSPSSYGNSYFKITDKNFDNYGDNYESYAGEIVKVVEDSDSAGTIFIKYTRAATADWSYSTDKNEAPDVGNYYAISYKNLTENSISFSGAYKADGKTSTDTLEEAVKEFTIENGYFSSYSECVRQ